MKQHDEESIRQMLQRLARAVTTGDGQGAADCWEVPGLVASDDGTRAVSSLAEAAAFFGGAKEQYNQQGIAGTRPDVQCVEWHTDRIASVTVAWPYLDGDGRELGRSESSTYLVRVDKGQAKIFAAVMMGVSPPAGSPG